MGPIKSRTSILFGIMLGFALLVIVPAKYNPLIEYTWLDEVDAVQGTVTVVSTDQCPGFIEVFSTCFNNNAAAPYIVPMVPVEDAYNDPDYAVTCKPCGTTTSEGVLTNIAYRLDNTQAMVTVVKMPSRAAYFSHLSYVFTRDKEHYIDQHIDPKIRVQSPDSSRWEIFGSTSNGINNNVMSNQLLTYPWNKQVIIITTGNPEVAANLIDKMVNTGIDRHHIFVEELQDNVLLGTDESSDDLLTLYRFALPEHAKEGKVWQKNVTKNVLVYKVTDSTVDPDIRYAAELYTARTGNSERHLEHALNEIADLFTGLDQAGFQKITLDIHGEPHGLVGKDCIAKGTECAGDNTDTATYAVGPRYKQGTSPTWIIGVNHNRTGNSTYISLSSFNTERGMGVASVSQTNTEVTGFNSGNLDDSAREVLKELGLIEKLSADSRSLLPMFYIASVQRGCTIGVSTCMDISEIAVPTDTKTNLEERAYVRPGSTTGANVNIMLTPIQVGVIN